MLSVENGEINLNKEDGGYMTKKPPEDERCTLTMVEEITDARILWDSIDEITTVNGGGQSVPAT